MIGRSALPVLGTGLALILVPTLAVAQGASKPTAPTAENVATKAADGDARPPSVKIGKSSLGALYTDAKGRTLYAMDMRTLRSRYGVGANYCKGPCADTWNALAAPKDAAPIGRWTIVAGGVGPQWAWKGNPVFTYAPDPATGSVAGNGYEDMWSVIAHVPPAPQLVAPAIITATYVNGTYHLADAQGHLLFTPKAACADACSQWQPLLAGLASRPVGKWQISRDADRPRWLLRGKPVFVAQGRMLAELPKGTIPLSP